MKVLYIFSLASILSLGACNSNKSDGFEAKIDTDLVKHDSNNESDEKAQITFEATNYDFGTITEGSKVTHSFKFKNTGTADLIIGDARGNCGCTVPKYPTQPIAPGDEGVIEVEFNSAGKHGKQNKSVTLLTNTVPSTKVLTISGEVNPIKE